MRNLAEFCVYTILHPDRLAQAMRNEGATTFTECKPWVRGRQRWQMAKAEGQIFPLILADATDCTGLVCWGTITDIEIDGQSTRYTIENVQPIPGSRTPQELVLSESRTTIAPNFIRPYANCLTPAFLRD